MKIYEIHVYNSVDEGFIDVYGYTNNEKEAKHIVKELNDTSGNKEDVEYGYEEMKKMTKSNYKKVLKEQGIIVINED